MNGDYVYVKKGNQKTRFTRLAWKNMGKNKNGWTIDESKNVDADNLASEGAENEVKQKSEYQNLVAQGNGFYNDGLFDKALEKYEKAYAIRKMKTLEVKISNLSSYIEIINNAQTSETEEDWDTALEFYNTALELIFTENVNAKIAELTKKLEN